MSVFLIIMALLFVWHFIAQAIFIPNRAHDSKYELYAQRDKLRRLYIKNEITNEEFVGLDEFVSSAIKLYRNVTIYDLIRIKKHDVKLGIKAKKRLDIVFKSKNVEYSKIRNKVFESALINAIHNSIGWLPYIIVPSIFYLVYLVIVKQLREIKPIWQEKSKIVVLAAPDYAFCN